MNKDAVKEQPDPNSDDAIRAMLAAHPGLLGLARSDADRAIARCHQLNQAPRGWILWKIEQTRNRIREQAERLGGGKTVVDVVSFREFRAATGVFTTMADRWERATHIEALRAINRELDKEIADEAHRIRVANQPLPAPVPPFDAMHFVRDLSGRGVALAVNADGGLTPWPPGKLTERDRAAIGDNRAAVAAAAASLIETF